MSGNVSIYNDNLFFRDGWGVGVINLQHLLVFTLLLLQSLKATRECSVWNCEKEKVVDVLPLGYTVKGTRPETGNATVWTLLAPTLATCTVLTQGILIITRWRVPINELRLRFGEDRGKGERERNSPLASQASNRCRGGGSMRKESEWNWTI